MIKNKIKFHSECDLKCNLFYYEIYSRKFMFQLTEFLRSSWAGFKFKHTKVNAVSGLCIPYDYLFMSICIKYHAWQVINYSV